MLVQKLPREPNVISAIPTSTRIVTIAGIGTRLSFSPHHHGRLSRITRALLMPRRCRAVRQRVRMDGRRSGCDRAWLVRYSDKRTTEIGGRLSQVTRNRRQVAFQAGSPCGLEPSGAGQLVPFRRCVRFHRSRSWLLRNHAELIASLGAPQGHLVIDQQRHQLLVVASGAAIELGDEVADDAGEPVGASHLQSSHRRGLEPCEISPGS